MLADNANGDVRRQQTIIFYSSIHLQFIFSGNHSVNSCFIYKFLQAHINIYIICLFFFLINSPKLESIACKKWPEFERLAAVSK